MPQHTTTDSVKRVEDIVNKEAEKEYHVQIMESHDRYHDGFTIKSPDYFEIWLSLYDKVIREFHGKNNPPRRK